MDLLLIGGVSGSGKSVAIAALEDSGYYAVSNLPLSLLPALLAQLKATAQDRVAIVLDVKTEPGLDGLSSAMIHDPATAGASADAFFASTWRAAWNAYSAAGPRD